MGTPLMQLRRLTRSRLGVPAADEFFNDAVVDDTINMALTTLSTEHRWPWLERVDDVTLAEGDVLIPAPAGWSSTRAVFWQDRELQLVSPTDLLRWSAPVSASGPPQVWTPTAKGVEVRPATGGDMHHAYFVEEVWLEEDDDEPSLPDRFVPALVAKAAELLSQREDDRAAATMHATEYLSWIGRMRKAVRSSTGPVTPRVRSGSWINV